MKKFIIPEDLAQAVVNYLTTRPYREVAGLIAGFGSLEPLELPKDADKDWG